jgi:fermentation-respiration switch protein FrsA (DUF1100 family)
MLRFLIFSMLMTLFNGCSGVFYYPDRVLHIPPEKVGLIAQDHWFQSNDGTKLNAWHLTDPKRKEKSKGLFVLFHGNAENLSSHHYNLSWAVKAGYDLFVFDYRGYGRSEGKATPEGVIQDGISAISYAHEKIFQPIKLENIQAKFVVVGQSLGGMIAPQAVMQSPLRLNIDLLVLEATFSSYRTLAKNKLQASWATWIFWPLGYAIVHEATASKHVLPQLSSPTVIVIHGTADTIVPMEMGEEVYATLPDGNKFWWVSENRQHLHALFNNQTLQTNLLNYLTAIKK